MRDETSNRAFEYNAIFEKAKAKDHWMALVEPFYVFIFHFGSQKAFGFGFKFNNNQQ